MKKSSDQNGCSDQGGNSMVRLTLTLSLIVLTSLAMASEGVNPEKGRELFSSKRLGTNGKSCNLCHAKGKGLEKASLYDDRELGTIINQCIMNPLKGKALDPSSSDMKSLVMYVKSLTQFDLK
jgi:cytochrome c